MNKQKLPSYPMAEDELIRNLIEIYTGMPLKMENDKKIIRKMTLIDRSRYTLFYDGILLGSVSYIQTDENLLCKFDPCKEFRTKRL